MKLFNNITARIITNSRIQRYLQNYTARREHLYRYGIFHSLFNSSGYVLAIVLILTTLMVTLATEFLISAQTNISIMNRYKSRIQATYLAKSGIELGKYVLYGDQQGVLSQITGKSVDKNTDSYLDGWAMKIEDDFGTGTLSLQIDDEQSKINLSVLANEFVDKSPYYEITQNFFIKLGFVPDYADAIIDWVDIDDAPFSYGAESADHYLTLIPPYSARNSAMESINDLLLVKGFTPEIFYGLGGGSFGTEENLVEHNKGDIGFDLGKLSGNGESPQNKGENEKDDGDIPTVGVEKSRKLSDYLRVHGERKNYLDDLNKININTASYRVLSALTIDMTDDKVAEIIVTRLSQPYSSVDDISHIIEDEEIRKNVLTVKSSLFRITATAKSGQAVVKITAVYNRDRRKFIFWSEE